MRHLLQGSLPTRVVGPSDLTGPTDRPFSVSRSRSLRNTSAQQQVSVFSRLGNTSQCIPCNRLGALPTIDSKVWWVAGAVVVAGLIYWFSR